LVGKDKHQHLQSLLVAHVTVRIAYKHMQLQSKLLLNLKIRGTWW
jgi:hypothetical protein